GKTSILESVCILLRLQSPRAGSLGEAVRFDQPGFGLDGHWGERHMHTKFTKALKHFALDSKPQSRSVDYLAVARVVWISNDDLQLVRGSGSHRRRYLDFLGAQVVPNYLRQLRVYERALRSRNALLKDNRPRREISAFDSSLIEAGVFLLQARAAMDADLRDLARESCRRISGDGEPLEISYVPGSPVDFAGALENSRDEEVRLRTTVVGPHRDDIAILLGGREAVSFASEGQQRSVALALKLAQAGRLEQSPGDPPVYLIDDIFGELDPARRNNLLRALPPGAQKLITATSLDWLDGAEDAALFSVGGRTVTKKK
ncbi:MAG: DNA replication/repair protein RecF, partial [Terrimicrobiaceae bacterium]